MQDTDGSYFENFTALSWRHENRRLAALRLVEARSERAPPAPHDLGLPSVSAQLSHKEHEHLYTEVRVIATYLFNNSFHSDYKTIIVLIRYGIVFYYTFRFHFTKNSNKPKD